MIIKILQIESDGDNIKPMIKMYYINLSSSHRYIVFTISISSCFYFQESLANMSIIVYLYGFSKNTEGELRFLTFTMTLLFL